jgi:hypothetical protein
MLRRISDSFFVSDFKRLLGIFSRYRVITIRPAGGQPQAGLSGARLLGTSSAPWAKSFSENFIFFEKISHCKNVAGVTPTVTRSRFCSVKIFIWAKSFSENFIFLKKISH